MDFYSNSRPNLIPTNVRNKVKIMTHRAKKVGGKINSGFNSFLYSLYSNYIKPNKELLVIILLVCAFVLYRCQQKKKENESEEEMNSLLEDFINEEITNQTSVPGNYEGTVNDLSRNIANQSRYMRHGIGDQPTMNPSVPVGDQYVEEVNYRPDSVPINIDGSGPRIINRPTSHERLVRDNSLSMQYENLIKPTWDHDMGSKYQSRNYYTGLENTYNNAQDTNIINPLGFSNDFNSTTNSFVGGNVQLNQQNMIDYAQIMKDTNQDLVGSLDPASHLNDRSCNFSPPGNQIEAPYADTPGPYI